MALSLTSLEPRELTGGESNLSGAKILFNSKSAIISGNYLQQEKAGALVEESVSRFNSKPVIGSILLVIDDINRFKDTKYLFTEFVDKNECIKNELLRQKFQQYLIKSIKEPNNGRTIDELADVLGGRNLEITDAPNKSNSIRRKQSVFDTADRLDEVLKNTLNHLSIKPLEPGQKIKFRVYFGRQTFFGVNPQAILSVNDFRKFSEYISTTFVHSLPKTHENLEKICERFELKPDDPNEENESISITLLENDQRKKIKLCRSKEDGSWEIEKVVKNIKRVAIISVISGSEIPDLRFMVKTKRDIYISPKLKNIIKDLQTERPVPDENGLRFKLSDFEGKLDGVIHVRQKINKNSYSNDKFKITKVTEISEMKGKDQIKTDYNVSLKNLRWRKDNQEATKVGFDNDVESIRETIEFAREIAKSVINT
ncbi:18724_t:CDS:2 [Acaulospora morrowiae]|uniref:18724_t:CDS:1 n=1 Tax=Acaulospora morrowiae TaxID=94023 RepID=A0A9N9BM67_9GLOM|nr:18724_t:CDS:2 [Acaulospora morrowiae]